MMHINFKEEDVPLLAAGRYTQPHPRVMQKYDALHLKSHNLSNAQICHILGIRNNTLLSFFRQYNEGGLGRLKEIHFNHP
ncbi:hypothetical protein EZS27_010931, partial [termite gut metagenome]